MPSNPLDKKRTTNPLYENTEGATDTQSTPLKEEAEPIIKQRVRTSKPFDQRYDQFTSYIDRQFQQPFIDLLDALSSTNKTDLFNEAIYDLFQKYHDLLSANSVDMERLPRYPKRPRL